MQRKKVNGAVLRALRLRRGFTLKDLSAKCGISDAGIIKLESGETSTIRDESLIGLSKAFEMDVLELEKILTESEVTPIQAPASAGEGEAARGDRT